MKIKLINGSYHLSRVTIFIGNFGSGKTEVAVNFALTLANVRPKLPQLSIVDLDIVNPYFRCREACEELDAAGIGTVFPKGEFKWADLPIILPEVKGVLENKDGLAVLDVGGDDIGARILSSLSDSIDKKECDVLFVLNISRPFTSDAKGATKMMNEVSEAGGIPITGLAVNPHLIQETAPELIYKGILMAEEVSKQTNIPIRFVSAIDEMIKELDLSKIGHPVLSLKRRMLKPWEEVHT